MPKASHIKKTLSQGPCEVRFDDLTRTLYATDASIYQIEPLGVAFPRTVEETTAIVRLAVECDVPMTPRGAGTGLAGGAIGDGLIIDLGRHFQSISELDLERETVRVGAGVVLDQLNAFLQPHGYWFGPDVATSSRATLGGMIANNSSGARAPLYGTTDSHVVSLDIIFANGAFATVGVDRKTLPHLLATMDEISIRHAGAVMERLPNIRVKRWPGFGLDRYLRMGQDLVKIVSGSEGALAMVTSAVLRITPLPTNKGLGVIFFEDVAEAMAATVDLLDLKPAAIEHVDRALFDQTRGQLPFKATRDLLGLDADPSNSFLMVEFYDNVKDKLTALSSRNLGRRTLALSEKKEAAMVWALRKAGLSLLTGRKGPAKPIAGIEDVEVRPEQLPEYHAAVTEVLDRLKLNASFYGHAESGLLHVRPIIDLHRAEDIGKYRVMMEEVSAIVTKFRGSFAAEHGVGIARMEFLAEHLGSELCQAMKEIKDAFDPHGLFNPGKIVPSTRVAPFKTDEHLRWGADYKITPPFEPVLAFAAKDESFVGNLEQCNGCGGCKKQEPTMCPTFLATQDELMSTRGRANIIRAVLDGKFKAKRSPILAKELTEAIGNCLSCKACTAECPSNVNMSLLKAELMHARHKLVGLTLRERMVSEIDRAAKLASWAPGIVNPLLAAPFARRFMDRFIGFTAKRPFPKFAAQRFDVWFRKHKPEGKGKGKRGPVLLWDDVATRYYEPEVGKAAVKVLEAAGYRVMLAKGRKCDGRPAMSVGRLYLARKLGEYNTALLSRRYPDMPVIFLEPSSYAMFVDDYRELGVLGWEGTAARSILFEQFIFNLLSAEKKAIRFRRDAPPAAIHVHCHAKALTDASLPEKLIRCIPNAQPRTLLTGCCGMAGQFGQLTEKYELSVAVAQPLVAQVNALPAGYRVVAGGTSCRSQISHLTEAKPIHIAQYLADAME